MRKTLKRIVFTFFKHLYFARAKFVNGVCTKSSMTTDQANEILIKKGYTFKPLSDSIPPLRENRVNMSFIIPVYNAKMFLSKCLNSILSQQSQYSFEVICVNDGSTDNSCQILSEYQLLYKDKLRIITQDNQGISAARNRGLEEAYGTYVGFIDNDDMVSPNYVESIMQKALDTDADVVQTGYQYVRHNGQLISYITKKDIVITSKDPDIMFDNFSGYIWGGILKKSLFDKIRFPHDYWYEDMITKMLIMRIANKVAFVKESLYIKLIHHTNASVILWKNGNIKSIDVYWLAVKLTEYAKTRLDISPDMISCKLLLYEWSGILVGRTQGLSIEIRKALFWLCSNYIKSTDVQFVKYDKYMDMVYDAYLTGNYEKWLYVSKSILYKYR